MTKAQLLPHHKGQLTGSAIAEHIIDARGYQSVGRDTNTRTDSHDKLKRLGIPGWARREPARYPGLLIPLYRATGELISWQYRPDHAPSDPTTGKPRKYASPAGRANVLDVHPVNRDHIVDPTVPLWVTEGVKKGDALTSAGACVVTLTGVFNWRTKLGTLGDWEDVPLKGRDVIVCFDADAATNANVARAMARCGRWLHSKGASIRYIVTPAQVGETPTKGADDYLAAGGVLDGLVASATTGPPEVSAGDGAFSDAVLAEVLADELLAERYRWTSGLGWLGWGGRRWRPCEEAQVLEDVRQHYLAWFTREVRNGADSERRRNLNTLLSAGRIRGITGLARGIVLADAGDFDRHPDLLNTPNGIVDLRTSQLHPHDPELLLTKMTAAEYDPTATHPDWTKALEALPEDVRPWMQLRLGQAITGHTPPDDRLVTSQGGGENGKTTIYGAVAAVLDDFYTLVSDRVLLANPEAHPTELMELRGARFALVEETPEARRLSVARLKKTVGTPQIEARHIRKDSVTFDATHSLFLSTNYRPIVEETDHGTWRRLLLVRFPYRFVKPGQPLTGPMDRPGDPLLRDRLRTGEAQRAVLRWLIDGARAWYELKQVMPPVPARVEADTRAWRVESDQILAYVDDRLVPDRGRHVMSTEMLADFNEWLVSHGHRPWSDKVFTARFGEHDELAQHHIEKRKVRHSAALSRRLAGFPAMPPSGIPATYAAWLGVRFQTDDDTGGAVRPDQPEYGHVPAVPGHPGNTQEQRELSSPGRPGTAGTCPTIWCNIPTTARLQGRHCDGCGQRVEGVAS